LATSPGERPLVLLRADGGSSVGLGHVHRCQALSAALTAWADGHLLLHGEPRVARASTPVSIVGPAWDETLTAARRLGASALVVDSYAVTASDLSIARGAVPLLVLIDDAGRYPVPADIVINAALGPEPPTVAGDTTYLLGPRFALLAPEFASVRRPPVSAHVRRVLVVLGGATPAALMGTVTRAVRRALPSAGVDIVVGPLGDSLDAVRAAIGGADGITFHESPETLESLMEAADLAVTAGGVALLELAAAGLPSVGICLAANQEANLAGFARAGATVLAGRASDAGLGDMVAEAVRGLAAAAPRQTLAERARALVDGHGASRVAACIRARLETSVRVGP